MEPNQICITSFVRPHVRNCRISDPPKSWMDYTIFYISEASAVGSECHEMKKLFQATTGDDSVIWIGRVKLKVAPPPLLVLAHNRPPCESTMERLMANPMPLPWGLVVKKAEKI
jgi:hypothetical protein